MTEFDRLKRALDKAVQKLATLQAKYDQQQYVLKAISESNVELRVQLNIAQGIGHRKVFDWESDEDALPGNPAPQAAP